MKSKPLISSFIRLSTLTFAVLSASALSLSMAAAETIYWDGTGASWATVASWSMSENSDLPNPEAIPGAADDVVFNMTGVTASQTVALAAEYTVRSITSRSSGTVSFGNGGGNRNLLIGEGGITLAAGAGNLTIGNTTANSNAFARVIATQTWTNFSGATITSRNNTAGSPTGVDPVTLTMSAHSTGQIIHSGALNDGAMGAVVSLVVDSPGAGASSITGGSFSGGTYVKRGLLSSSGSFGAGAVSLGDESVSADVRINGSGVSTNPITVQAGSGMRALTGVTGADFRGDITLTRDASLGSVSTSTTAQTIIFSGAIKGDGNITVGRIAGGSANLVVSLSGPSSYTGRTTVESATLVATSLNRVIGGSATSSLGAPTTASAGTISLGSVAASGLRYIGTGETSDRIIDLAGSTNGVTLEQAGSGHLLFESNMSTSGSGAKTLTLRGATAGTAEFGGVIANSTGATAMTKLDSGTWKLSGLNTYTGNNNLSGGVLEVTKLADGGQPSSIGASSNTSGALSFGGTGGTLRYLGSGDSTNRAFNVGSSGATFDASGSGAIVFAASTAPSHSSTTLPRTITFTGANIGSNTMSANIGNGTNTTGLTSVVKSGVGTWRLAGLCTYTGTTSITGGVLEVTTLANGGTNSSIGASTNAAENLKFDGGTLKYIGAGASTNRAFTLGNGGAVIDASGTGAVSFTNVAAIAHEDLTDHRSLTLTGASVANNSLAAVIGDAGDGKTSVVKSGAGKWILTGVGSYTGNTAVNGGTLELSNAFLSDSSTINISSDATLHLSHDAVDTVAKFQINGVDQGSGTFNAANSGGRITGTGSLFVPTVATDPFAIWMGKHPALVGNDALKSADPDQDGLSNFVEFALDGDPNSAAPNARIRSQVESVENESALVITFPVLAAAVFDNQPGPAADATIGGAVYSVGGSNDLLNFDQGVTEIPASSVGMPPLSGVEWTYRSFRLNGGISGANSRGPKGFLRIGVAAQAP